MPKKYTERKRNTNRRPLLGISLRLQAMKIITALLPQTVRSLSTNRLLRPLMTMVNQKTTFCQQHLNLSGPNHPLENSSTTFPQKRRKSSRPLRRAARMAPSERFWRMKMNSISSTQPRQTKSAHGHPDNPATHASKFAFIFCLLH